MFAPDTHVEPGSVVSRNSSCLRCGAESAVSGFYCARRVVAFANWLRQCLNEEAPPALSWKENVMPNAQKELMVSDLREIATQSKGAILTDYRGLTVAEVTNLRKKLRDVDAEYHVVKNTLFKIALGDQSTPELDNLLTGPTAIAFAKGDVVAPTKAVIDFLTALKKPEIKLKGGFIDGKVYDVAQVTALSKLPAKEVIIGQLIGSLNAPASNLVGTLDNIIGDFVRTVQAIVDKQSEGSAPAA